MSRIDHSVGGVDNRPAPAYRPYRVDELFDSLLSFDIKCFFDKNNRPNELDADVLRRKMLDRLQQGVMDLAAMENGVRRQTEFNEMARKIIIAIKGVMDEQAKLPPSTISEADKLNAELDKVEKFI